MARRPTTELAFTTSEPLTSTLSSSLLRGIATQTPFSWSKFRAPAWVMGGSWKELRSARVDPGAR